MSRSKAKRKGAIPRMDSKPGPMLRTLKYGAVVNECNRSEDEHEHEEDCDGNCERLHLTDLQVDLHNEVVEWNRRDMMMTGIPMPLMGGPFNAVGVEILETEMRMFALFEYLIKEGVIDEEKLDETFKRVKLEKLKHIRKIRDDAMAAKDIAVAKTKIILPGEDGKLH